MLISFPVWIDYFRTFPKAPVFRGLTIGWLNDILSLVCFLLLIVLVIYPLRKKVILVLESCFFILILDDQCRFQPWLFLFSLMLLSTVLLPEKTKDKVFPRLILLILSWTYFWGGIQKMNPFFSVELFPWLMEFTGQIEFFENHSFIALIVAAVEGMGGIALMFPKSRKMGAFLVLGMHLFILISLGPFGHNWNYVVWPWNICFAILIILLTWYDSVSEKGSNLTEASKYYIGVFLLVAVLPVLGIFNKWDHFLSGGYYSSLVPEAIFYFEESDRKYLSKDSAPYLFFNKGTKEEFVLLDPWALNVLGVPLYQEVRVKKEIAKSFCDCMDQPEKAGLRVNSKNRFTGEGVTLEIPCKDL